MSGFLAIMRKEFRHVLRDPYVLGGVLLGTVLLLVLVSWAVSADIEQIPIAVYDGDLTPASRAYMQRFVNETFFHVARWTSSAEEARDLLRADQVRGVVIVQVGFAEALQQGQAAPVQIIADGTEPNIALQIAGQAEALSMAHSAALLEQRLERTGVAVDEAVSPLELRVRTLYNPTNRDINAFLPGMIGFVLTLPAMYAGLSLVREWEQGSLESLLSTPVLRHELIIGKAIPYLLMGLLDTLILTGVAVVLFDVPFRGSLIHLVLLSAFFLLSNIGVSLLIATLLPAVAIVRERETGTLEQLFVTPLRSLELIVGKATLAALITFVGFLEALAVSTLYLAVPMRGSLALLLALGAFYIFVEMGWGLVISAVVRTQGQAFIATLFWLLLESILSGQILPVENMPRAAQAAAQLMPSTHFSKVTRGIMLRGSTLTHLWPQVIALAMLGIGLYALAAARLQKRVG